MRFPRKCHKANHTFKKVRPGTYQVSKNCIHKEKVNKHLAMLAKETDADSSIITLENIDMLTTRKLISAGIEPNRITAVECNKHVFKLMNSKIGNNIINGNIEDYIADAPIQKISVVYFDFMGNIRSLHMFRKGVNALKKHIIPNKLIIATTFCSGRGMLTEPELYNNCLDILEDAFSDSTVRCYWYYQYKRPGKSLTMHHYQFVIKA